MKIQRFLILVFAAALTAGTSSANSTVAFMLTGNTGGVSQSASLMIDGVLLGSGTGNGSTAFYNGSVNVTDGWHSIEIDYTNTSGPSGLTLLVNGGWAATTNLASYDAGGNTINGLQGNILTLLGAPITTIYGGGEGPYINYTGGSTAPWVGTYSSYTFTATSTFQEQLTGYIYFGAGTPSLADVPSQQQTPPPGGGDGGGGDTGSAPEPAGWWLMAAAPLMLLSKLRLNRANVRP